MPNRGYTKRSQGSLSLGIAGCGWSRVRRRQGAKRGVCIAWQQRRCAHALSTRPSRRRRVPASRVPRGRSAASAWSNCWSRSCWPASSSRPWSRSSPTPSRRRRATTSASTATNIAQDRIEKIRMLNFADITADNLNSSTFADNEFGTQLHDRQRQAVHDRELLRRGRSEVQDDQSHGQLGERSVRQHHRADRRHGSRTRSHWLDSHSERDPEPALDHRYQLHADGLGHRRRCRHDIWGQGRRGPTSRPTSRCRRRSRSRTATNALTVSWTGLIGGPDVVYRITIKFKPPGYSTETLTRDVTLLDSTSVYFDTNPHN